MYADILVFPVWKVSGRFTINMNYTQENMAMKNAVHFGALAAQAEIVEDCQENAMPQPNPAPEPKKGELVDARERFARKRADAEDRSAVRRMREFFACQREKSRARCEVYGCLKGLWV